MIGAGLFEIRVRPISIVPAPSALRRELLSIQAAMSRNSRYQPPGAVSSSTCGLIVATFSAVYLVIIWRHCDSFGWNHWRPPSVAFICCMIALPSPTSATSVGRLWPISSGPMSSWMTLTSLAQRGGRPKPAPAKAGVQDPVEPGAHQEDDVGVLQCQGVRRQRPPADARPASHPCPSARRGTAAVSFR